MICTQNYTSCFHYIVGPGLTQEAGLVADPVPVKGHVMLVGPGADQEVLVLVIGHVTGVGHAPIPNLHHLLITDGQSRR